MTKTSEKTQDLAAMIEPHVRAIGVSEVARRAGMKQPVVSRAISGKRNISTDVFARLCAACGLKVTIRKDS